MKASDESILRTGRWIRPAPDPVRLESRGPAGEVDVDALAAHLLRETRRRVSGLAALERELEDRIRLRWEQTEEEVRRKLAHTEEELGASRKRAESELKEARIRAEKDGRGAGFREGFARGREEGYRLGLEEGKREGQKEGQRQAREEETQRLEGQLSGAAAALIHAVSELRTRKEGLYAEARAGLLELAIEIARKLVKRELGIARDVVVRNVEQAIDLIARGGFLAIQVNPQDAAAVEEALKAQPRWSEGFDRLDVVATADVDVGGCRLVSGAGIVDMTLETQLSLIESALVSAADDPAPESRDAEPARLDERPSGAAGADEKGAGP